MMKEMPKNCHWLLHTVDLERQASDGDSYAISAAKDHMNANSICQLGQATVSGARPLPEIVNHLNAEGVEYYHVDVASLQIHFYGTEGGVVVVPLLLDTVQPIAPLLDRAALRCAILDSQQNGQTFKDFS